MPVDTSCIIMKQPLSENVCYNHLIVQLMVKKSDKNSDDSV